MFLFMYCNNHCPVNLKERRLFEVIVPTSDYYQRNKQSGNKMEKRKKCPRKFHSLQLEVKRKTDDRL